MVRVLRLRLLGLGFSDWGSLLGVHGFGFRDQGLWFKILRFRV